MRLTRAAQRAQQGDEVDATDLKERTPLNEITPNASPELRNHEEELPKKTPAKKSKAKKGRKGKKGKAAEEEQSVQAVVEDGQEVTGNPTNEEPVEFPAQKLSEDVAQAPTIDERPASPPSKAVRLTRRQLAKQEEELKQSQKGAEDIIEEAQEEVVPENVADVPVEEAEIAVENVEGEVEHLGPVVASVEQESEVQGLGTIAPSVEITSVPEPKTLSSEKPSEDVMTPIASRTSSRRASRSPSKSPMRIEDSIEALDALEEALENVEAVTNLHRSGDDKSPQKQTFPQNVSAPNGKGKTPRKTPLAVPKVSRNPSAAPKSMKPMTSSLARASSIRFASSQDVRKGSTDTVDHVASKRRPISVSFPTPPPPPKGRAPTKAAFQLSSTAVLEKLKAEKEERLKRQAEGVLPKPRPVSISLPPKSTKPLTKANFELSGDKIAAELKAKREERLLKKEAEGSPRPAKSRPLSMPPPAPKSTKPLTKANFELPGSAVAARLKQQREERLKRQEEAEAAKKTASLARPAPVRKPVALPTRTQTGVAVPPPGQSQGPSSNASKRDSIQLSRSTSASSPSRNSVIIAKSIVTPVDVAVQKVKGREVFNRDKMEKEARERERKEKEDAAKKARAEAAERGRIASREWAEKQKKKMMGMAA